MNTTQIRTSLKASNVTAKTKKAIEGVGAVLKGFKTYAENQSVNLSSPSAPASMKANLKGFQDALTARITQDVAVSKYGNDTNGKVLGELSLHQDGHIFDDQKKYEERHYHDEAGSHISFENGSIRSTNPMKNEKKI